MGSTTEQNPYAANKLIDSADPRIPNDTALSSRRIYALLVLNAVAAFASLWFVPLIKHIYTCTQGQKWCHVQAMFLGTPSAIVWLILLMLTAWDTFSRKSNAERFCASRLFTWLLLTVPFVVLLTLGFVVSHNSR